MILEELDKFIEEYGMEEMERVSYYIISTIVYCVLMGSVFVIIYAIVNKLVEVL